MTDWPALEAYWALGQPSDDWEGVVYKRLADAALSEQQEYIRQLEATVREQAWMLMQFENADPPLYGKLIRAYEEQHHE